MYVTTEDAYLTLDGENVVVNFEDGSKRPVPLHTLESIVLFTYKGASPSLMGKCSDLNISLAFYSPSGKYLASASGRPVGNVFLRREQYRVADDDSGSLAIAKNMVLGKLYNCKFMLLRCARDHSMQADAEALRSRAAVIDGYMDDASCTDNMDSLRGIEGNAAAEYFSVFDEMILQNKDSFVFAGRNRRPPLDNVNAMLSFAYSLLAHDCAHALNGVGLDPYVGFMHADRPGRESLSLDLEEELRPVFADRFVLTLINNRILAGSDFKQMENGAVLLTDEGRKAFLSEWQKRKREEITHPYLKEKIPWGLVPHVQSMLLARYIRGELDGYPSFFWK